MADSAEGEVLMVSLRETRGTRAARKDRSGGSIPAILYGHGEETVSLSVSADSVTTAIRHGAKVVTLSGAVSESVFIRDVQWDSFGAEVLHLDFTRVSADELIQAAVALEVRGVAPGTREGGVVSIQVHELQVECTVASLMDKLVLNINSLNLGDSITVDQLELPEGAKVLADPSLVIVQCVEPAVEVEESATVAEGAEPEIIGRKEGPDEEGA